MANKDFHQYDYVIDCRGFPKDSTEHIPVTTIPVNHCLVNTIDTPGDWNYTSHQATKNGWMFGIPLQTRQGWGYLYNDTITTKDEAVADIADIFNTSPDKLTLREFSFKNYKAKKFINGRIIKNGNMALFYEPIEALSGWFYDNILRAFFDVVVTQSMTEDDANNYLHNLADEYETFICYMYHGGSVFDSKFWNITSKKCKAKLNNSSMFKQHIKKLNSTPLSFDNNPSIVFPMGVWRELDKNLKYQYLDI
jgi:hypothetical protein